MDAPVFYTVGFALVILGALLVFAAVIYALVRVAKGKSKMKGAGLIMIGPIPIIFGSDKESVKEAITLGLALTIALIILVIVYYWLLR